MKKIILILSFFAMQSCNYLPAFANSRIEELDVFVRHHLMIEKADMSYTVQADKTMNLVSRMNDTIIRTQGERVEIVEPVNLPVGNYDHKKREIKWDGRDEAVIVHEIAHHYGANEDVAQWVEWCYRDSKTTMIERLFEIPLFALSAPLRWLSSNMNKSLPGGWKHDEWIRYNGSIEPWPQESWKKLKK